MPSEMNYNAWIMANPDDESTTLVDLRTLSAQRLVEIEKDALVHGDHDLVDACRLQIKRLAQYQSQSARDAADKPAYALYLEMTAIERYNEYMAKGEPDKAKLMLTRSLSEALQGNGGN